MQKALARDLESCGHLEKSGSGILHLPTKSPPPMLPKTIGTANLGEKASVGALVDKAWPEATHVLIGKFEALCL